jgi:predicted dehydrogenase
MHHPLKEKSMNDPSAGPHIAFAGNGLSRREFITGTAAIASTLGVSLTSVAEAEEKRAALLKDNRPVNCAFVGLGDQGYNVDFKAALSVPGARMVAVCDIYQPYLDRALKDVPEAKGYTDYRAIMDRKDIEAVLIATPLYLHAPVAIAALQSGKHVFTEKMMAWSIEDGKNMARAARDNKRTLQIGHQRRANPMYNHAWELITQKKVLGQITHIRAQWNRNGSWRKPPLPGMDDRHRNWRMYREYSHGLMSELGTHQIHAVNWFLGSAPTAVVGMGGIDYWKDGREIFDNVEVIFEYPNGVKLNYTSLTTNQYDGYYEQFMGKDGTLIISEEKETPASFYREPTAKVEDWMKVALGGSQTGKHKEVGLKLDPEATKKSSGPGIKIGEKVFNNGSTGKSAYVLEMEDFFNSVRTGSPVTCDWKEALGCTVAAVRADEAMWGRKRVEIPASDTEI